MTAAHTLELGARLLNTRADELVIVLHHDPGSPTPRWPWTARLATPLDAADGSRTWAPHHVVAPAATAEDALEKLERMLAGKATQ